MSQATVYIVDDDRNIRHAMEMLMRSVGHPYELYSSADEFLADHSEDRAGCLVLDIRMPGLGGLELQQKLNDIRCTLPIIFITGHADVPMAVDAMQKGAMGFIQKPFRDQELLDQIAAAFATDSKRRFVRDMRADVEARLKKLTAREREVLDLVVTGMPNKVIAYELGVSQRTIEIHRARVMDKMQAGSLAELVRLTLIPADASNKQSR